jgi:uncharacterized membrane protein
VAAWVLFGASVLWLAALSGVASGALEPLASSVFRFASFLCHQLPDRSFFWGAAQWPVCARCLGLYAAAPAGAVAAVAVCRSLTGPRNFLLLSVAALPTAATWLAERAAGMPVSNTARFAAALPLGAAVVWVIACTLAASSRDYSTRMK